jgi:hypothetical protein
LGLIGGRNSHGKSVVGTCEGPQSGSKYQLLTLAAIRQPYWLVTGGRYPIIDPNNAGFLYEHAFFSGEIGKAVLVRNADWWPQSKEK